MLIKGIVIPTRLELLVGLAIIGIILMMVWPDLFQAVPEKESTESPQPSFEIISDQ